MLIVFIFGIFTKVDGAIVALVLSGPGVDLSGIDLGLRMAGALFAALSTSSSTPSSPSSSPQGLAAGN